MLLAQANVLLYFKNLMVLIVFYLQSAFVLEHFHIQYHFGHIPTPRNWQGLFIPPLFTAAETEPQGSRVLCSGLFCWEEQSRCKDPSNSLIVLFPLCFCTILSG